MFHENNLSKKPFFFKMVPGPGKKFFAAIVSSYTSLVRKCCSSKGHEWDIILAF
jgi:hypothetical protein